jgi:hypothetical protein
MFTYAAYNLAIHSEISLPELPAGPPGDGLKVRVALPDGPIAARSIEWRESPPKEACFYFTRVGKFVVRDGREVIITPDPDGDPSIFRLYVQGMMLASALHQRGFFVLHASVVDLGGRAIAIVGPIGAGKSTLASALYARGHLILADDNAAIDLSGPAPRVLPAFPSLKIYPEVARSLGHREASLQPMHASQVKHAQSVADGFSPFPLRLDAIYVLDREAESPLSPLSAIQSVTELIRHSVPTRWDVRGDARHLQMCALLTRSVPLFRLRTFTELHEIPAIADLIEGHPAHARLAAVDDRTCVVNTVA